MPEMLRFQRRGENIYYTPLSDDRHHILIDDMSRDSLKRLQEDGFRPAVVLESSPGNYQCLLTIPKLGTEFDRDVGNRITERLNREYGDKNCAAASIRIVRPASRIASRSIGGKTAHSRK